MYKAEIELGKVIRDLAIASRGRGRNKKKFMQELFLKALSFIDSLKIIALRPILKFANPLKTNKDESYYAQGPRSRHELFERHP